MGSESLINGVHSPSQPNGFIETSGEEWLVQKFGGTSVGKFPLNIVDNVVKQVLPLISANNILIDNLQTEIITWQSCDRLLGTK